MEIVIIPHEEAVEIAEARNLSVLQVRIFESLKRSKIFPQKYQIPARIGLDPNENSLNFTINGVFLGKNDFSERAGFVIEVDRSESKIEADTPEIREILENIVSNCIGENSYQPLKEVKIGAAYQHCKGGIYFVIGEFIHTETSEKMIGYSGEDGKFWVRPREMFIDGRFQLFSE